MPRVKPGHKRIGVDIPEPLHRRMKVKAALRGVSLEKLVAIYLKAALRNDNKTKKR